MPYYDPADAGLQAVGCCALSGLTLPPCTQLTCPPSLEDVAAFSLTQVVNQLCNNNRLPRLTVAVRKVK